MIEAGWGATFYYIGRLSNSIRNLLRGSFMLGMVLGNAFLLVLYCYVVMPPPAHAYFDLGTGAYLIQLVFGVGAAFFLSFKSQVVRKLGWAKKPKAADVPPQTEETTEEPA